MQCTLFLCWLQTTPCLAYTRFRQQILSCNLSIYSHAPLLALHALFALFFSHDPGFFTATPQEAYSEAASLPHQLLAGLSLVLEICPQRVSAH